MHSRILIYLVALAAVFVSTRAVAQPMRPDDQRSLDTIDLIYGFDVGESVTYRVVTNDTLVLYGANTVMQAAERSYVVSYTCDSLVYDGYIMTMRYGGYVAREWRDSLPTVTRTSHPWTERSYTFLMTPDGRRVRLLNSIDVSSAAPAGPFQPLLLPYIGDRWTYVGSSQAFDIAHWLIDNVAPAVLSTGTTFRAVTGRQDILGLATIGISITDAARAKYEPDDGRSTSAIINSESHYWFSPLLGFPVAGELVTMNKLEMRARDGAEAEGRQIIHTTFGMIDGADEALRDTSSR